MHKTFDQFTREIKLAEAGAADVLIKCSTIPTVMFMNVFNFSERKRQIMNLANTTVHVKVCRLY